MEITHNGIEYSVTSEEDDYGYGKIKITYTVTSKDRVFILRHSPYEKLTRQAFEAHAYLGFPDRHVPWRNEGILGAAWDAMRAEKVAA